jgi:Kef-type K+ transport system membrane component KefB
MGRGKTKTSRTWGFVLLSGVVAAAVVYVLGPADSGVVAALAVGGVVFLMFSIALTVSNGRVKQILVELLSLLP